MEDLRLYNSLTKKKEIFEPINIGRVGLYTCGPTVYNYAHIGNLRTYVFEDVLKRVLKYNGYEVRHIMNITDVGHLTGDQDMGEDKLEKGARREGVSAWDVAEKYEKAFREDLENLNVIAPNKYTKATKYINEQIEMIEVLDKKGFTYVISDGIYFDTAKFADYNKLSHLKLEELQEGARVEKNDEKRNATDFAVWKFSPKGEKRQMEWWFAGENKGKLSSDTSCVEDIENEKTLGFPGWHLECSAMSLAELDGILDIHCGGIDHVNVHHTNEIAQSEAATGRKFFNYWMHGAFLNIEGGKKMAKSEGNFLTLNNVFVDKGIDPLVFRLMCLGTRYRKPMMWNDASLKNYIKLLNVIREGFWRVRQEVADSDFDKYYQENELLKSGVKNQILLDFEMAINDDMNMPLALSFLHNLPKMAEVFGGEISNKEVVYLMLKMDDVFGLNLKNLKKEDIDFGGKEELVELSAEVLALKEKREEAREAKNWEESDGLRDEIEALGYVVEDSKDGMKIYKQN